MKGLRNYIVLGSLIVLALLVVYLIVSGYNADSIEQITALSNVSQLSRELTVQKGDPDPPYIIPNDEEISKMDENKMMHVYWRYINIIQTLCHDIVRVGSLKDGGKEICLDGGFKPTPPCLVYSFGINNQWDFDKGIVARFGCDVHCFDPSMKKETSRVSEHIWFYKLGLGARNEVNSRGWTIKTLDEIRKLLGHTNRTIDILKIDIEGGEWESIPQMISSGALDDVKQISMETHFLKERPHSATYYGGVMPSVQLRCLRQLYEFGYRIFMRERNMWSYIMWPTFNHYITHVNEISVIKKDNVIV